MPPHTIISLPVHIAVCSIRAEGALITLVAVQVSSVNFFDSSLLRDAFFECERPLRSGRRRLRTKERQSRSNRDQNEASCHCAKKETEQSAQIKEGGLASGFLLHCRSAMWGAPRSWMPDGVKHFPVFLEFSWSSG